MPGDYISGKALQSRVDEIIKINHLRPDYVWFTPNGVKALAREIPAADVVEVVRCGECIFWDTSWNPGVGMNGEAHYCPRCHLVTLKDSFCSGAYRKDGGQDNV